jgi:hypothetical protein
MEIVLGEPFRLPQVGKDVFRRLMQDVRLEYDRQRRVFRTTPQTDLYQLATLPLTDAQRTNNLRC